MIHDQSCDLPCTEEGCEGSCDWIFIHNQDDGKHLCWKHIREYEEELHTKEKLK
jgi:hypothetical protein